MCCCNQPEKVQGNITDPVCGMAVDPAKAGSASEYQGIRYFFCCPGCKGTFDSAPSRYLPSAQQAAPVGQA